MRNGDGRFDEVIQDRRHPIGGKVKFGVFKTVFHGACQVDGQAVLCFKKRIVPAAHAVVKIGQQRGDHLLIFDAHGVAVVISGVGRCCRWGDRLRIRGGVDFFTVVFCVEMRVFIIGVIRVVIQLFVIAALGVFVDVDDLSGLAQLL